MERVFLLLLSVVLVWDLKAGLCFNEGDNDKRRNVPSSDFESSSISDLDSWVAALWDKSSSSIWNVTTLPFSRDLILTNPPMKGQDVIVAQLLLSRAFGNERESKVQPRITGLYDQETSIMVSRLRRAIGVQTSSTFDSLVATHLLGCCSKDSFEYKPKKNGSTTPAQLGYKYAIYMPVHLNRSIETEAQLMDGAGKTVYTFKARAHGHRDDGGGIWPDYTNDIGLNVFTTNGNTPTGLMEIDLNTPEDNPVVYGKSNVNRVVRGLQGNAIIVPLVRNGILIHSGEWPGWENGEQMPNSSGCIHVPPDALATISNILQSDLGVLARPNPLGSSHPYPYKPQGLLALELIVEE